MPRLTSTIDTHGAAFKALDAHNRALADELRARVARAAAQSASPIPLPSRLTINAPAAQSWGACKGWPATMRTCWANWLMLQASML